MRLYSRTQLIIFGLLSIAVVVTAGVLSGFIRWPWADREATGPALSQAQEIVGEPVQFNDTVSVVESLSVNEKENIGIYKSLNEAVVNITSLSISYNWFLQPIPEEGTGSGSIIDRDGHVLTNYHVIEGADQLTIRLSDGTEFEGKVVGRDRLNDLAVLKFNPRGKKLTAIPFGRSEDLQVGQKVLAIGNPFGLERTLTTGIVSGLGRPVRTSEGIIIQKMIQTDASINPGNSGGPLLNSRGEMIGINTMIYTPTGTSVGIGFAVPAETARRIIPDLIEYGVVKRGWLDLSPVQLTGQLVRFANLPVDQGLLVSEVEKGGASEQAGIQGGNRNRAVRLGRSVIYLGGDIIVEVDGDVISSFMDLLSALEDNVPGEEIPITVVRGRRKLQLMVPLVER
jgi:S1-C subfamily serine protease